MAKFSEEYILRILVIVLTGVFISNAICYTIWRRSAITKLKYIPLYIQLT